MSLSEQLADGFSDLLSLLSAIFLALVWILTSIITFGTYQYLAGDKIFPLTEASIFIGTPIAIILLITITANVMKKRFSGYYKHSMEKFGKYLYFFTLWMLLPIAINTLSTIAKLFGFDSIANLFFNLRYQSLYISVIMIILYFIIRHYIKKQKRISFQNPV